MQGQGHHHPVLRPTVLIPSGTSPSQGGKAYPRERHGHEDTGQREVFLYGLGRNEAWLKLAGQKGERMRCLLLAACCRRFFVAGALLLLSLVRKFRVELFGGSGNNPTTCPPLARAQIDEHSILSPSFCHLYPPASTFLKTQASSPHFSFCHATFVLLFSTQREARAHARGGQEGSGSRGRGRRRGGRRQVVVGGGLTGAGGRVAAVLRHGPVLLLQAHQAHHREGLLQGDNADSISIRLHFFVAAAFLLYFDMAFPPVRVCRFSSTSCRFRGVEGRLAAGTFLSDAADDMNFI